MLGEQPLRLGVALGDDPMHLGVDRAGRVLAERTRLPEAVEPHGPARYGFSRGGQLHHAQALAHPPTGTMLRARPPGETSSRPRSVNTPPLPILSGVIGGPGKGFLRFHNTSFQVSVPGRLDHDHSSRSDDAALGTLGCEPEFRAAAGPARSTRSASDRSPRPAVRPIGDDERERVDTAQLHDELDRRDL